MPDPGYFARRALQLGPGETARRALAAIGRRRQAAGERRVDVDRTTYASLREAPSRLGSFVGDMRTVPAPDWLEPVGRLFLAHRFDLLGSGWCEVGHGREAAGAEGHRYPPDARPAAPGDLAARQSSANREESARIRSLITPGYDPIDWHVDFKSGFRWAEDTWYRDIAYGDRPGVDVKVPWELARAQHLPLLAWLYAQTTDPILAEECRRDFRDEILDFVAANPPRFGVNWACTMDVAIRIANWLVAYDVFLSAGAAFDEGFEAVFRRSVLEHGRHILGNLEWSETLRGNHYLADVVGLLFAGAYLPDVPEAAAWREQATTEVLAEATAQFSPDGSNFEASTAYHRLSAELLVYAVALIVALPDAPVIPDEVAQRLERAAGFALDLHRPDGRIVQFGDNDSGRLFKFGASYERLPAQEVLARFSNLAPAGAQADGDYLLEEHLDVRHVASAIAGVLKRPDLAASAPEFADAAIVRGVAGGRSLPVEGGWHAANARVGTGAEWDVSLAASRAATSRAIEFACGPTADAELRAYPDFGFFLARTARLWLAVRCGPIGQNGNGGHAHSDQLAVEIFVDGRPVWVDPGTYLYTPLPARRDEYRSVRAHHVPQVEGREPGRLDELLFRLGDEAQARCVYFGPRGFLGFHDGYGARVWRRVELGENGVRVVDWVEGDALVLADEAQQPPYSRGYGWAERVEPGNGGPS